MREGRVTYQYLKVKPLCYVLIKLLLFTMKIVHTMTVSYYVHTLSTVFLLSAYFPLRIFLLMLLIHHLLECALIQLRLVSLTVVFILRLIMSLAPSGPPQDLSVKEINVHDMEISWTFPQFPNGIIAGFTVSIASLISHKLQLRLCLLCRCIMMIVY